MLFSFGNIEDSKILQIVTSIARIITVLLLYGCTLFYLGRDGVHSDPVVEPSRLVNIANAFGNTVFAFIFHNFISGIVVPVRP